jgi:hypothetical protein
MTDLERTKLFFNSLNLNLDEVTVKDKVLLTIGKYNNTSENVTGHDGEVDFTFDVDTGKFKCLVFWE